MIPFRTKAFADSFEFCIDSAVEAMEITGAAHMAVMLYGDPTVVQPLTGWHLSTDHRSHTGRRARALELESYAMGLLAQLPDARRRAILGMCYPHIISNIVEISRVLASWAFEDLRIGGFMLPFRRAMFGRPHSRRIMPDGQPTPRLRRRLYAPKFIRHYVHEAEEPNHYRILMRGFFKAMETCSGIPDEAEQMRVTDDLSRIRASIKAWPRADRTLREARKDAKAALEGRPIATPRARVRARRRAIRRSAALVSAILGASAVSAFARGEPVTIPGQTMLLQVSRTAPLYLNGHGTVRCALLATDGKGLLADLCVYHEGLNPLDQLAAFALEMGAGLEADIVNSGNVTRVTTEGVKNPLIASKVSKLLQRANERHVNQSGTTFRPRDTNNNERERRLADLYFDETGDRWRDEVGVFVIGRRWRNLGAVFHRVDASQRAVATWDDVVERLNTVPEE